MTDKNIIEHNEDTLETNNIIESDKNSIEKFIRCTITIPLSLSIKLDIERKTSNLTRSAYIRKILETHFTDSREEETAIKLIERKLDEIKALVTK